jgi:hypothetical protein
VVTPRSCFTTPPHSVKVPISNVEFRARALCKDVIDRMNVAMKATYHAMHTVLLSAKSILALPGTPKGGKLPIALKTSEPGGVGERGKGSADAHLDLRAVNLVGSTQSLPTRMTLGGARTAKKKTP